jgi:hypothetical protein
VLLEATTHAAENASEDNVMSDFFSASPALDNMYYHMRKCRDAAAYAQQLWDIAEPYLDEGRPAAAARAFHATVWEMYVAAALLDQGHAAMRREQRRVRNGGPDIQIGNVEAWVEAVIATAGVGDDAVPPLDTDLNSPMSDVPDRELLLRITNAFDEKWRKYLGYRAKEIVGASEPFVIAINGAELPTGVVESSVPRIVRAVFGIGSLVVSIDRDTLHPVNEQFAPMPGIAKLNGSPVGTTHFRDSSYAGVSAVMWGFANVSNRPEFIGRDVVVVHNPHAANPLPHGWFREGVEYWAEKDESELHCREWGRERA